MDNVYYYDSYYMFDEQEQKLLQQALNRTRKDYKNNSNVYQVSGFDENFDQQLRKLVILYAFDFQAIALHLYFKFPQYSFRMKPQAVSYRWYQLTLQNQGERIKQGLNCLQQQPKIQQKKEEVSEEEEETQEVVIFDLQQKKAQYQAAMKMAAFLDQEQQEGFMVYRPKFIMDSQFKLQRQKSQNTLMLSALLQNELNFQFGAFNSVHAAPFNINQYQQAAPHLLANNLVEMQQQYLDDDWQAYESD